MKQLKMECGTILFHKYNSLVDVHELRAEDYDVTGTRVVLQSKINIGVKALPEVIEFLQEVQRKHETT